MSVSGLSFDALEPGRSKISAAVPVLEVAQGQRPARASARAARSPAEHRVLERRQRRLI
jgi:hypothetical protein